MNVGLHQAPERVVHHAMPLEQPAPIESIGDDPDLEMTAAVPGARVAGMQVTLVFDEYLARRKCGGQPGLDVVNAIAAHGSTGLNGLTVTFWYTPAAT